MTLCSEVLNHNERVMKMVTNVQTKNVRIARISLSLMKFQWSVLLMAEYFPVEYLRKKVRLMKRVATLLKRSLNLLIKSYYSNANMKIRTTIRTLIWNDNCRIVEM